MACLISTGASIPRYMPHGAAFRLLQQGRFRAVFQKLAAVQIALIEQSAIFLFSGLALYFLKVIMFFLSFLIFSEWVRVLCRTCGDFMGVHPCTDFTGKAVKLKISRDKFRQVLPVNNAGAGHVHAFHYSRQAG